MKKLFILLVAVFCFSSIKAQTVSGYAWYAYQEQQLFTILNMTSVTAAQLQSIGEYITLSNQGMYIVVMFKNNTTSDFAAGDIFTYEMSMNGHVYENSFTDTLEEVMGVDSGKYIILNSFIPTAYAQDGENNMCIKVTAHNGTPVNDAGSCIKLNLGYTSIEENTLSMAKVYPNPVRNTLTIDNVADANISIYSITGQLVQSVPSANGNVQIDISAMAAGLYIVKMENGKQTRIEKIQVVK
ncbi:MAG: T9SS type A sorting domain-containing protein [Bacteroidales bacterium]|nr:T9SS type A sorting domain-containing protein [Bacteroidales bacterium]